MTAKRSSAMDQNDGNAASRNDLAEDRTILASERTFAGWMRTSFGSLAIGIGLRALFGEMQPYWLPRAIATGFFVLAIILVILAERRAAAVREQLSPHVVVTSRLINLRLFAGVIAIVAVALVAATWLAD